MNVELSVTLLWIIVLSQGAFLVVLYRQVGMAFLARSEAIAKDGPRIGERLPVSLLAEIERLAALPHRNWTTLVLVYARERCQVCKALWPHVTRFLGSPDASGVAIVVVFDQDPETTERYRRQFGLDCKFISDSKERLFSASRVRVSPFAVVTNANFVVSRKGLVNHQEHLRILTAGGDSPALAAERRSLEGGSSHAVELVG